MKKLLVLAMMVTMVMGFSFVAFANNEVLDDGEIEATAKIGGLAELVIDQGHTYFIDFPQTGLDEVILSGAKGLYSNDGVYFESFMMDLFDADEGDFVLRGETDLDTVGNLGKIKVTSNMPIDINFSWDGHDWLNSPTAFGVFDYTTARNNEGPSFAANQDANLPAWWGGINGDFSSYVGFFGANVEDYQDGALADSVRVAQAFEYCTPREYLVVMGINIEEICQNEARAYEGNIGVTLTAMDKVFN